MENTNNAVDTALVWSHAWNYFELHSKQRMQAINFFLILSIFCISAFATITTEKSIDMNLIFLPLILILLSFLFYKIDCRTKYLIKLSEEALIHIEKNNIVDSDQPVKIFSNEKKENNNKGIYLIKKNYSYSDVFNTIFFLTGFLGLIGFALCLISVA